jgi:Rieske 2Fe-2S family protein
MYHTLWPQSPGATLVTCEWLFHPDTLTNPAFKPDDGVDFWDVTNRQDWHIVERSQLGIASRRYVPGPYSARESIPAAWDEAYLRLMGR